MKALGASLLLVAAAALAAACRQIAGIDDRGLEPPGCGNVTAADAGCNQCVRAGCCDLLTACAAEPGCSSALSCLVACEGTPSEVAPCRQACRKSFESGFGERLAGVLSCQASKCSFECGLSCGGYVYPNAACGECGSACCTEATACMESESCVAMSACAHACSGASSPNLCASDCKKAHLAGASAASAFSACLTRECPKECGDPDWWCIDHPPEILKNLAPFSFEFHVIHALDGSPVPQATIKVCPANDVECSTPDMVADAPAGIAEVTIPAGFAGYFELSAPDHVTLLFVPRLYLGPGVQALAWELPTDQELDNLFVGLGAKDPAKGHVRATAANCVGAPAPGVSIEASPSAKVAHSAGGLFSTAAKATDASGRALVLDAGPGSVSVEATVVSIARTLDARVVPVRAGCLTDVVLAATK